MDPVQAKNETDDVPFNDNTVDGVTVSGGPIIDRLREKAKEALDSLGGQIDTPLEPSTPKAPQPSWLVWLKRAGWAFILLTAVATAYVEWQRSGKIVIPDNIPPFPGSTVQSEEDGEAYGMGWADDPQAIAESHQRLTPVQFSETPAGKIVQGEIKDVFLWHSVRKAAKLNDSQYPNVNQRDVGCCVGCAWKHAADVALAFQILNGALQKWEPCSVEVIYGLSRVEIGGGKIRGDGSIGAWAREGVRTRGVAPMKKYSSADLTEFSPARAREFGRTGVPNDIEDVARTNPIQGTALVRTWVDVAKAIEQGYPVAVCSNVGFNNPNGTVGTRDRDGFCVPRGTWPHAMCFIGTRGGQRPGAFCLNSWGDTAHGGPVWPADAPRAGFWVDAAVVERMVSQNDSFAVADVAGFPARKIDWFTQAQPAEKFNKIKNFDFALAP